MPTAVHRARAANTLTTNPSQHSNIYRQREKCKIPRLSNMGYVATRSTPQLTQHPWFNDRSMAHPRSQCPLPSICDSQFARTSESLSKTQTENLKLPPQSLCPASSRKTMEAIYAIIQATPRVYKTLMSPRRNSDDFTQGLQIASRPRTSSIFLNFPEPSRRL